MKIHILKTFCGRYGNSFFYRSKWMVLLYSLGLYLLSDALLFILLRSFLVEYLSFSVFVIALIPAILLEFCLMPKIFVVTFKRRISIYLLLIMYSILHGLLTTLGNVDVSALIVPVFRTIIFGIISLIIIFVLFILQKV